MSEDTMDQTTPEIDGGREAQKLRINRLLELYLWLFIACFPIFRPGIEYIMLPGDRAKVLLDLASNLFYSFIILIWPFLFQMVFGTLPLEALRTRLAIKKFARPEEEDLPAPFAEPLKSATVSGGEIRSFPPALALASHDGYEDALDRLTPVLKYSSDPRQLLFRYAKKSSGLAQRIYTRAGIYLMVGVLIAIGGLGFFYVRSINLPPEKDLLDRALSLLPGFGVLFFIEFVALFFLRQHRAAMDDFRYYDAVRRHREENLIILTMFAENKAVVPAVDVIKAMTIYSGGQKLMQGETTEILEARRLQRDDIVIFEKLVEAFGAVKEAAKESKKK